jgi:hypothetical protein
MVWGPWAGPPRANMVRRDEGPENIFRIVTENSRTPKSVAKGFQQ